MKQLVFVSSVQKELAEERKAIRDFVQGNRLLDKHFDVFIFEDLPAASRRPDELYLDKVEACSVFIALFAMEFVMSRLARSVGTRAASASAPVKYEMPMEAVREIIVNAVAHRDYTSNAAVQVSVFSDRIEVWNPGSLPRGLRPDDLAKPHSSEPANPLIARPLYLAHYIESLGTGTLDVIRRCRESDLPLPQFEQRGNQFVVTLWRDWLTAEVLAGMGLNDRQMAAIPFLRAHRAISSADYQLITSAPRRTAARDLESLVAKSLLKLSGAGRGARYVMADAPAGNAPKMRQTRQTADTPPPAAIASGNAPEMRQMGQAPTRRAKGVVKETKGTSTGCQANRAGNAANGTSSGAKAGKTGTGGGKPTTSKRSVRK